MSKIDCVEGAFNLLKQKREKAGYKGAGVQRETLQAEYDKILANPRYSPETVVQELVAVAAERIRVAAKKRANTLLMYKAENDMFSYTMNNFADNPIDGLVAYIAGVQSYKQGSRSSAYAHQQNLVGNLSSILYKRLNEKNLWDDFSSGALDTDVRKEIYDLSLETPSGNATKNQSAKELAKILYDIMENMRLRANRAGADIGKLQGYFGAQTHDRYKIRNSGLENWKRDIKDELDYEKTFGQKKGVIPEDEVDEILDFMYKEFISGKHLRYDNEPPALEFRNKNRNIGGSLSAQRFFHFKDADAGIRYADKYGSGSFREEFANTLINIASKTALMERMGPNPQEVLKRVVARVSNAIPVEKEKVLLKFNNNIRKVENHLKVVDGTVNVPENDIIANSTAVALVIQTLAKLGGAPLSAIADIATAASKLQFDGFGYFSPYKNIASEAFSNLSMRQKRETDIMFGVFTDHLKVGLVYHHSGLEGLNGKMTRAMNLFFKMTGLQGWTNIMRGAVARSYASRIAASKNLKFSQLHPEFQRNLSLYNIDEKDFEIIKRSVAKVGEYEYASPSLVGEIDDAVIREIYGDVDAKRIKQDVTDKFRAYLIDNTEGAVLAPDARTISIARQGTQAGTVEGAFNRLIMQFKSFPIAFTQKVLGRELYGKNRSMQSNAMGVASVMLQTTALGYVAMSIKDLLKGREPRDPLAVSTWTAAMMQGGGLGIYGDFILGNSNRFGGSLSSTLLGPTLGEVEKAWKIYADLRDGKDPSGRVTSLIAGNIPFANVWWYKPAVDYLILYQIQEAISPGSLRRMEKRIEEDNKQEMIIRPSEIVPSGGLWGLNQ